MKKLIALVPAFAIALGASFVSADVVLTGNIGNSAQTTTLSATSTGNTVTADAHNMILCHVRDNAAGGNVTSVVDATDGALTRLYSADMSAASTLTGKVYWYAITGALTPGSHSIAGHRTIASGNLGVTCYSFTGALSASGFKEITQAMATNTPVTWQLNTSRRGAVLFRNDGSLPTSSNHIAPDSTEQCVTTVTGNRCLSLTFNPINVDAGIHKLRSYATSTFSTVTVSMVAVSAYDVSNPLSDIIGNAQANTTDAMGFDNAYDWMRNNLLLPILGTGLGTLYELRWYILGLIAIAICVFFGFRAFGFFRN